jgi:hypothetical protein
MDTITHYALLDKNNVVINSDYKSVVVGIRTISIGIGNTQIVTIIGYGGTDSLIVNDPYIGYTLDTTLNAFIPPKPDPTYLLDQTNFTWNPDPSLIYDLHNDGKLYRYDSQLSGWIPTWENDPV